MFKIETLKAMVTKVLSLMDDIGLRVMALVCDQKASIIPCFVYLMYQLISPGSSLNLAIKCI